MLYYIVWYWYFTLCGLGILAAVVFAVLRKWKIALISLFIGVILGGIGWAITYKNQHRYTQEYKQLAQNLDYTVYKPSYKAPDARETSVGIDRNQNAPTHPYVFFTYRKGTQQYYLIYQFNVDTFIAQFPKCGPRVPEPLAVKGAVDGKCQQVGATSNGLTIYKETPDTSLSDTYTTVGHTRIVVSGISDKQTLLHIFEGLKPTNPTELPFINRD